MKYIRYCGYFPTKPAREFETGDKIVRNFGIIESVLLVRETEEGTLKIATWLPSGGKPDIFEVHPDEKLPYA